MLPGAQKCFRLEQKSSRLAVDGFERTVAGFTAAFARQYHVEISAEFCHSTDIPVIYLTYVTYWFRLSVQWRTMPTVYLGATRRIPTPVMWLRPWPAWSLSPRRRGSRLVASTRTRPVTSTRRQIWPGLSTALSSSSSVSAPARIYGAIEIDTTALVLFFAKIMFFTTEIKPMFSNLPKPTSFVDFSYVC